MTSVEPNGRPTVDGRNAPVPDPGNAPPEIETADAAELIAEITAKAASPEVFVAKASRAANVFDQIMYAVLAVAFLVELVAVIWTVVGRKFYAINVAWEGEITQLTLAVLTIVGGAVAYANGSHLSVQLVIRRLPVRWQRWFGDFGTVFICVVCFVLAAFSISLLHETWNQHTEFLHIRRTWMVVPYTAGMALFSFYALRALLRRMVDRVTIWIGAVTATAMAALCVSSWQIQSPLDESAAATIGLILIPILLFAGIPIGVVLAAASFVGVSSTSLTSPTIIPRQMTDVSRNFLLLAIPFFVLAGMILASSRVTRDLTVFVDGLVGRIPGGILHVIVVTMYVFSGMSGSKSADMVAVGSSLKRMLEMGNYNRAEATGVLSATAVMGETIPPSLALLVLGSVTTLSIETLFAAGIVPAALLGLCLIALVWIRARRSRYVRVPVTAKTVAGSGLRSIPAFALPVLLVGGIVGGFGTPTEVSSFAVVYGFLLVFVLYRVPASSIWMTCRSALAMAGMILFILSAAGPFAWLLTAVQIPQRFASFAVDVGQGHTWVFVLISMVLMIMFGALLEGAAAIIILAPILVPAAIDIGVNPIVFGLVLVISLGIGAHLPLIGIGSYIAASTLGTTIEESARPGLYYLGIAAVGLLVIGFVPEFALWLPRLFGLKA